MDAGEKSAWDYRPKDTDQSKIQGDAYWIEKPIPVFALAEDTRRNRPQQFNDVSNVILLMSWILMLVEEMHYISACHS